MKRNQLPQQVLKQLKNDGISEGEILHVCPFDLSFDGEYISGYLFLTAAWLGVAASPPMENQVRYFRGTKEKDMIYREDTLDYVYRLYPVAELEKLKIEKQLATNLVTVENKGVCIRLAALTNLYMEQMNLFVKGFERQKNGLDAPEEMETGENKAEQEEECCPVCGAAYPDPKRKICPKCMNKRSVFVRTAKYFLKYYGMFIILFVCYILTAVFNLVWPYFSGTVFFDRILSRDDAFLGRFGMEGEYLLALTVLVFGLSLSRVLQRVTAMVQQTIIGRVTARTVRDMTQDVFDAMGRLSVGFFTGKQTGSLMTRVMSDATNVLDFFIDGFPNLFINGLTIIATFIVMFRLNWLMALIALVLIPLLVIISVKLKPKLWSLYGRRHRAERNLNGALNDNLNGARVVKAFGQQRQENERFEAPNEKLCDADIRIVKYNNRFTILFNFVQEISSIWVWILGVILLMETKSIGLGVLITFVGYVAQLNGPMNFFSWIFRMWTKSINAAQRMFEVLDAIPDIQEAEHPVERKEPDGEIELSDVTFGYNKTAPVLKNISLHVLPGEVIGIVGRSGAGKTTLVNLISRLYDVDEGEIRLDGIPVKQLAFHDLRRNVAMVSQDTYIFMGTVAQNIAYSNPDATRADIIKAAMFASAHEFISNMPDGYDTVIGASGKELSGGEKQRISIARAVLANPKILILDEATASVDTETEKAIQKSLNYLVRGRTTLSIAHRLSTLRDADRLVVIDNGRIVEEGTHEELAVEKGIYYKLMELQTKSLALKA